MNAVKIKLLVPAMVLGMTLEAAAQGGAGDIVLPNDAGQTWKEYDISSYTAAVAGDRPQQTVVDWVLRETGTNAWFGEKIGILSAGRDKLRVYHDAERQEQVARVVERLVRSRSRTHYLNLRMCTIANPNWRTQALRILQPHAAQSPGVEAWLLSKEDAAVLIGQLSRRTDYREHNSPNLQIRNGEPQTITKTRPRTYVRTIRGGGLLGAELVRGSIDEGFTLQLSPLLSADEGTMDAVVQCHIDQVEKLMSVPIDYVSPAGQTQRLEIEVPQIVSWRLLERFRWPVDRVLLLSCGVVAQPAPEQGGFNLPIPLPGLKSTARRADALLFVEVTALGATEAAIRAAAAPSYSGRY